MYSKGIKVSVQIPTYNQKSYIAKAVKSVLFQEHRPLEIVISDDASSTYNIKDHIVEVKPKLDENVELVVFRHDNNVGRVANYRYCLENLITGQYFMNLDGDDAFLSVQFIEDAISHINNYKEYNIVSYEFGHKVDYVKKYIAWYEQIDPSTILVKGVDYILLMKYYQHFMHAGCIFKTDVARDVEFYNINILTSDFFSSIKLYSRGYLILTSKHTFEWNVHTENASHTIGTEEIIRQREGITDFVKKSRVYFSKSEMRKIVNILHYNLFRMCYKINVGKRKDYTYYKCLFINFRINKSFLKFCFDIIFKSRTK